MNVEGNLKNEIVYWQSLLILKEMYKNGESYDLLTKVNIRNAKQLGVVPISLDLV